MRDQRILVVLLRAAGILTCTAFLAVFLPTDWMAATHEQLGLGVFPRTPLVDYLTRSVAALYGFHGVLVLLVSRDPVRHAPIVRYVGLVSILFGTLIVFIDLRAGLPMLWTVAEGPPVAVLGALVLYFSRKL
jgi:hypothetical protein